MSGDVQPRKRKDKRKKKDGDRAKAEAEFLARKLSAAADDSDEGFSAKPSQPASHSAPSFAEGDSVIHVDHEGGTGGHWCAKIIFFVLLAALIALIGLIIIENRGLEDADTPVAESRFAQVFDGWVDEGPIHDDHHDEQTLELNHPEEEEHEDDDHHEFPDEIEDIESETEEHDDDEHGESDNPDELDDRNGAISNDENDDDGASDEEADAGDDNNQFDDDPREEDEDDDIDEADFNEPEENEYLSREDVADDSNEIDDGDDENEDPDDGKNSAEFYDHENDEDPLEEVDSVEEDIVDNEAVEEEHLAAKKAEKLAEEENSDNTSDDDETVEIEMSRRMTLIDDDLIKGSLVEEKVEKITVKKVEAQKQIPKNTYEKEDEEEIEFLHKKISSMIYNEPEIESNVNKDEFEENIENDKVKDISEDRDQEPEVIPDVQLAEDDNDEIDEEEPEEEELLEEELVEEEEEIEEDISEELDDTELMKKLEEKYGKLPELDDELEGQSDDEKPVAPTRRKPKPSGGNSVEDDPEDWIDDDNPEWHQHLNLAQAEMDEGKLDDAFRHFTALTLTYPTCWRAKLGRAQVLDKLSHEKQSNNLLQLAIDTYREVLNMNITHKVFARVAIKVIDRIRFRGNHMEAIKIQEMLVKKFPQDPEHRNEMAISYLMVNKPNAARIILKETLSLWPNNGVALVHYGFILKTVDDNLEEGALYLQKGVDTKENGTLDGRFLYHLGDALARLGRKDEASKIYEQGAALNVFRSAQQRSLYNVDRLIGRAWWEPEQTPYKKFIKSLEANWEKIAQEAERLRSNYEPESENLKDTGDWSQFELFARGYEKKQNCARCPITCGIVRSEPAARGCRRGQIKFSAMSPGTHVHAHTGPTNCRLRAHLGLKGTDNTFIRVGDEIRQWQRGKVFIFDDSFEHEVWHNGTEVRIVLIVDLWHPDLTNEEKLTLPAI